MAVAVVRRDAVVETTLWKVGPLLLLLLPPELLLWLMLLLLLRTAACTG
jgi:hypothetical protein